MKRVLALIPAEKIDGLLADRGFDLESTHMAELDRMDKLMGILALAFA